MSTTLTANGAVALSSTGNPIVDTFVMMNRGVSDDFIKTHLDACWKFDPSKTLSLIFHSRDRAFGKKEKQISNRAMVWLKRHKPKTYEKNIINYINKYGRWKDIIYIGCKNNDMSLEIKLICDQLKADKSKLNTIAKNTISICAKWAPTEGDKYDQTHNIAHMIADNLFPDDKKKMEKYRKEYTTPLRKHINIVESYMASNRWTSISYDKVPAVASRRLRNAFKKHDPEGYTKYLAKVASGKAKMKVTGLLPHELIAYYFNDNVQEADETIELQWKELLQNIKSQGHFKNMIPVVDVSGSMTQMYNNIQPIWVSIAIGIIAAECSEGPFAKKMIPFHKTPSFYTLKGNTLYEQVKYIKKMPAGLNTNLEAVFDLILDEAKKFEIPPELMPSTVPILSDMQFDAASSDEDITEQTLHQTIINKYSGTPYKPPKIIYWNMGMQCDAAFQVNTVSDNVAIISGFSEQLLTAFMNKSELNITNVIYEILAKYEKEGVIDSDEI